MPIGRFTLVRRALTPAALLATTSPVALAQSPAHGVFDQSQALNTSSGGGSCTIQTPSPLSFAAPCQVNGNGQAQLTRAGGTATYREASAVGGPLKAGVSLSVQNGTADSYVAIARAGFYDRYLVRGAGASYLRFFVEADGIGSLTGTDQAGSGGSRTLYGGVIVANYGGQDIPSNYAATGLVKRLASSNQWLVSPNTGYQTGFVDVPVVGTVNNLLFRFFAAVNIGRPLGSTGAWSAEAESDFMNTMYVRGVAPLDAQKQDITGQVAISTASGTVVTPEPTTGVLLGSALLALGAAARRRRRQS